MSGIELNDDAWETARNEMCQRFMRMSAPEFIAAVKNDEFLRGEDDHPMFEEVVAYFPELERWL